MRTKKPRNLAADEYANPLAVQRRKPGRKPTNEAAPPEVSAEHPEARDGRIWITVHSNDGRKATTSLPLSASPEARDHARAQLEYRLRFKIDRLGNKVPC